MLNFVLEAPLHLSSPQEFSEYHSLSIYFIAEQIFGANFLTNKNISTVFKFFCHQDNWFKNPARSEGSLLRLVRHRQGEN